MTARTRLHELVDAFQGRRIAVFGDLVLDRFILGQPKRISREAPVVILRFQEQRDIPGGGANAMANLASLGATVLPLGVVGDDPEGRALLAALADRGIQGPGLVTAPGFRTVTKVRILAGEPPALRFQVARYDLEDSLGPESPGTRAILARLGGVAATAELAAVSDYGYGTVTPSAMALLRQVLPAGALLVADSRFALAQLGAVDVATPNLEELARATGTPLGSDEDVVAAAETLRRRIGARFLVATRGSQGLTLVPGDGPAVHIPVFGTDQVADVTGAGDTVLATLTLALAAGASPLEASHLANLAGGVVVMKAGTATVAPRELHRAIDLADHLDD